MLLSQFCTPAAVHCRRDASVLEAASLMRRKHVGALVVVDDPQETRIPVGLVTDRDLVVKVLGNELDPAATPVSKIMCTPLVTAEDTEDSSQAIERMRANGVRRLPIVASGGTLVGMVTLDDLLKLVTQEANALLEIVTREQDREQRTLR